MSERQLTSEMLDKTIRAIRNTGYEPDIKGINGTAYQEALEEQERTGEPITVYDGDSDVVLGYIYPKEENIKIGDAL